MNKRELIQLMVGLSYSTGYDHACKEQKMQHLHELGLDANYKDGIRAERQRIIQLFESKHEATKGDKIHNQSGKCSACQSLALIKGEQK